MSWRRNPPRAAEAVSAVAASWPRLVLVLCVLAMAAVGAVVLESQVRRTDAAIERAKQHNHRRTTR